VKGSVLSKVVAVIPARLRSMRLPNKVLLDIAGQPMVQHVWNRVMQATAFNAVYIATDADEVATAAGGWGANVLMTSPDCRSGTERIASVVDQLDADLIVNVQGDEPLIDPAMLDALAQGWLADSSDLITPIFRIQSLGDILNPNIVKVALTNERRAAYFSRSPIPFVRDLPQQRWLEQHTFWGHIGVYGYRRDVLAAYPRLPISALEQAEQLEQLRFLDAGYAFQTVETTYRPIAVDVAEDLARVRALIKP
jgi:3-deoxy-manno-octulosonate cytidylyltransferase (CMP-KDO synthetase)